MQTELNVSKRFTQNLRLHKFLAKIYLSNKFCNKIPIFWAFLQAKRLGIVNIDVNHLGKPVIF